jgi:hypothetical protein
MELKYSKGGIPYIEMDEATRIIFASTGIDKKGYKWLVVKAVEILSGKVGKGKRRYMFTQTTPVNFVTDFKLREFPRGFLAKHPVFTKIKHGLLKKIFKDLCVQDHKDSDVLWFPENQLGELAFRLDKYYNFDDEDE